MDSDSSRSSRPRHRMQTHSRRYLLLYVVLLVATLVVMALLYRSAYRDPAAPKAAAGHGDTLRVAIVHSPMSYYIFDDTIGGLNYDMLRRMSADTGRPVKFIPVVSLQQSLDALSSGACDVLASLPLTAAMRDKYLFSESVFLDRQVLVQRASPDKVKSVLDLAGDTIHIESHSPARERLDNLAAEIGDDVTIVSHDDLSDEYLFLKVAEGALRYAVVNEKTACIMAARHPDVDISTPVGFTQFQSWLTRRTDTTLHEHIDEWLQAFKATDDYQSLLRRYSAEQGE